MSCLPSLPCMAGTNDPRTIEDIVTMSWVQIESDIMEGQQAIPPCRERLFVKGVTPARQYLRRVVRNAFDGDVRRAAKRIPTLFWLLRREVRQSFKAPNQSGCKES